MTKSRFKRRKPAFSAAILFSVSLSLAAQSARAQEEFPVNSFDQAGQIGDWALTPTERTQPFTYGVGAGVGETDNVNLAPTDKVSQTMAMAQTDFAVHERSRLLQADALGNFSYIDYLQGAYGPQLTGRFDGVGNLAIIPGNLVWTLRDDFGKAALDPYTPGTPSNMESVNYISTGPDLALRVGGVNFIDLNARYARAQYQTSPYSSNRLLGSAAVGRDVSAGGSVSLNVTTERVLFDNTQVNADFERSSGFARYEVHGARTDIVAELGATLVRSSAIPDESADGAASVLVAPIPTMNSGKQSNTEPLAKLDLKRKVSAAASVFLTLGRDLTDASSSFSAQTTGITGINATTAAAQTAQSYRTTYATAGWRYVRNRTTLAIDAHWEKDVYPYLPQYDYSRPSADFTVERRLTRAFTAQLNGRWYKSDYPHAVLQASSLGGSNDYYDSLVGASLAWRHGRGLEVRVRVDHDTYSVNTGDTGYHETRAFLSVGYRPLAAQSAQDTATP